MFYGFASIVLFLSGTFLLKYNLRQIVFISLFVLIFCGSLTKIYLDVVGTPREVEFGFLTDKKYILKSFHISGKDKIYIWVIDENQMISFSVKWTEELAQKFYQMEDSVRNGNEVMVEFGDKSGTGNGKGNSESSTKGDGSFGDGNLSLTVIPKKEYIIK